jgi:hypothetical protein
MQYTQDFNITFTHTVRDHVRQAGDYEFARPKQAPCPAGCRMIDEHGFRAIK